MLKSYKYRIYPNDHQKEMIDKTIGCSRLVYNLALETKIEVYKGRGINLSSFDLCYQLVDLKKEVAFLNEVDSQALQASVKKIDVAFKNLFKGGGYPKFKSKRDKQSFQCPCNTRRIDWENSTLTIPKIKDIPIRLSRRFEGKIKTVTITKTLTGKYFASILVDNSIDLPKPKSVQDRTTAGLDLGLKHLIITDQGIKVDNPKYLKSSIERLKVLQRRASKKQKGSANRRKANLRVAIQHEKVKNQRLDYIHKVTSKLVGDNQTNTFVMEDLNVKGMLSNHRLAQAITDVSWGEFVRQMKYKCEWSGKNFIQIDRFVPSSKTCSNCGSVKKELSLREREFRCEGCGFVIDRDENAAINIKNFGLKNTVGRGTSEKPVERCSLERSVKQEIINVN